MNEITTPSRVLLGVKKIVRLYATIIRKIKNRGKNMKKLQLTTIAVASAAMIMMTGCATKAGTGAAVGAGTGAVLGGIVGGGRGAAVGAAIGGASGVAIGANEDRKDRERYYRNGQYYYR